MKLLEQGMRLYGKAVDENAAVPFFPNRWTTPLAFYTRAVFPGLEQVIAKYNSPKLFYKENPAVADFFNSLRFSSGDGDFRLKDNVIYSAGVTKKLSARPASARAGWQKEVFFAMKSGYVIEGVPSEHVHILRKFAESGNLYSNLPALYPAAQYAELTSGHIKDPVGIISEVLNVDYTPLIMDRLHTVSYTQSGAVEIYIPAEDKVALVPAGLAGMLTTRDIFAVSLKNNILCLNEKPLHELCGKHGVYWKGSLNLFDAD